MTPELEALWREHAKHAAKRCEPGSEDEAIQERILQEIEGEIAEIEMERVDRASSSEE
jgi:hypothetical protein